MSIIAVYNICNMCKVYTNTLLMYIHNFFSFVVDNVRKDNESYIKIEVQVQGIGVFAVAVAGTTAPIYWKTGMNDENIFDTASTLTNGRTVNIEIFFFKLRLEQINRFVRMTNFYGKLTY